MRSQCRALYCLSSLFAHDSQCCMGIIVPYSGFLWCLGLPQPFTLSSGTTPHSVLRNKLQTAVSHPWWDYLRFSLGQGLYPSEFEILRRPHSSCLLLKALRWPGFSSSLLGSCDPSYLHILSSWDYSCELPCPSPFLLVSTHPDSLAALPGWSPPLLLSRFYLWCPQMAHRSSPWVSHRRGRKGGAGGSVQRLKKASGWTVVKLNAIDSFLGTGNPGGRQNPLTRPMSRLALWSLGSRWRSALAVALDNEGGTVNKTTHLISRPYKPGTNTRTRPGQAGLTCGSTGLASFLHEKIDGLSIPKSKFCTSAFFLCLNFSLCCPLLSLFFYLQIQVAKFWFRHSPVTGSRYLIFHHGKEN
jgi:hypothetical protein